MVNLPFEDNLEATRNVMLVLRLVLNPRGELAYGEVVDVQAKSLGRFLDWDGLKRILQEWLENDQQRPQGKIV